MWVIKGLTGGKIAHHHSDMVDQAAAISFPVQHATLLVGKAGDALIAMAHAGDGVRWRIQRS
ncbi:hypothetical protein D3C71_1772340 [compost metagenome]